MALIKIPTDHIKLRKTLSIERKPLLLKDYLRDDLSSCSSSGFKSFPRRQCCTTIRFLLQADLKKYSKDNHHSSAPKPSSSSALQRASEAVLNVVKLLPFPSVIKSPPAPPSFQSNSRRKEHYPPRTKRFSRKLFKRSFWRTADQEDHHGRGEIKRWKLFREFLQEKNQPSDQNTGDTNSYSTTDISSTVIITTSRVSTSRSSKSWEESDFTANVLQSWISNSERSGQDAAVSTKTDLPGKRDVSHMVGATGGEDSINCTEDRENDRGKQQSSPVSVLDGHFQEEDDDGSVFELQLSRLEGTKQKLLQKITRFERLAQLEPLELETRIAMEEEVEDEDKPEAKQQSQEPCLLKLSKPKIPLNILKTEKLTDWIQGCVKEMEEIVNWSKFNVVKEEVGSVIELELFSLLLDDLVSDVLSLSVHLFYV